PELETFADADHDDLLRQARVLAQKTGHHDAPGGVELRVVGGAVEEAFQLRKSRGEGWQLGERAASVAVVLPWAPDADARLQIHGHRQHHAVGERRSVSGWHRQAVLRVERMVEGATKKDH